MIRSVEYKAAQRVAQEALLLHTGKEVEEFLNAHLRALAPELAE